MTLPSNDLTIHENSTTPAPTTPESPKCPLVGAPPVSKLCHYTKECYCYMCICSEHTCPAQTRPLSLSPNRIVNTNAPNYQKRRHQAMAVTPLRRTKVQSSRLEDAPILVQKIRPDRVRPSTAQNHYQTHQIALTNKALGHSSSTQKVTLRKNFSILAMKSKSKEIADVSNGKYVGRRSRGRGHKAKKVKSAKMHRK